MSTTVTFDIDTDDEALRAQIEEVRGDMVMTWQLAVFCCQQQLAKALKAEGVREHYDAIHMRAKATRERKRS